MKQLLCSLAALCSISFYCTAQQSKEYAASHALNKLHITGDFDGDKIPDTIYQHNYSTLRKKEIVNSPDPAKEDWDSIVKWFYREESDVYLSLNKKKSPALHLGTGQGLYCLINIGDINHDGKDEIALVADLCDYSSVNTCRIYSLCNHKWIMLKEFGIHESAFYFTGDKMPVFNIIKGFLEKQNNTWRYSDYNQSDYSTEQEVGKMKILVLRKCGS